MSQKQKILKKTKKTQKNLKKHKKNLHFCFFDWKSCNSLRLNDDVNLNNKKKCK